MTIKTPSQVRDHIIKALEADLRGPMFLHEARFPGLEPAPFDANKHSPRDVRVTYDPNDGEEIITLPTARYVAGVLFPEGVQESQIVGEIEDNLDVDLPISDDFLALSSKFDNDMISEEIDEESLQGHESKSSIAISFSTVGSCIFRVEFDGGSYSRTRDGEGNAIDRWKRKSVFYNDIKFDTSLHSSEKRQISLGALTLEVGYKSRESAKDNANVITVYLKNASKLRSHSQDEVVIRTLFQTNMVIFLPAQKFNRHGAPYPLADFNERVNQLLYRESPIAATGHGCDVDIEYTDEVIVIKSNFIPVAKVPTVSFDVLDDRGEQLKISMNDLANWGEESVSQIREILRLYEKWISNRRQEIERFEDSNTIQIAQANLEICEKFKLDAEKGLELAMRMSSVRESLALTSMAMAIQQRSYRMPTRKFAQINDQVNDDVRFEPTWRPFQIAYLLSFIAKTVQGGEKERSEADLIWMPTGGGKTETYLAAVAFTIIWTRNHLNKTSSFRNDGTTVMMRYTLRLLTAQQFQRAASLICALESLRLDAKIAGEARISIGAWLGNATTPNKREDAIKALNDYKISKRGTKELPFLLQRCPSCATELFPPATDDHKENIGYEISTLKIGKRVRVTCLNKSCRFSEKILPVYEIDEDLYLKPPTLLIGTVDKFAMLSWNEQARAFFGIDENGVRVREAPELIIQDELHLLNGPLGSNVALFENAVSFLSNYDSGKNPMVIASTATIRNYRSQIEEIFALEQSRLVPPPGIDASDNFFSHDDDLLPGRFFVGLTTGLRRRYSAALARVATTVNHVVGTIDSKMNSDEKKVTDPYWTNTIFFSSLKDMGMAKSAIENSKLPLQLQLGRITGTNAAKSEAHESKIRDIVFSELTSASSRSASAAIESLSRRHSSEEANFDVVLATSVIEVGVDIDRLGLMTVAHQPKTVTSYIQATGRIGRNPISGPGLVITILDENRRRDMSFFERFKAFHSRLYAAVEPITITPYAIASLQTGLQATIAAAVRQTRPANDDKITDEDIALAKNVIEFFIQRATRSKYKESIRNEASLAMAILEKAKEKGFEWGDFRPDKSKMLLVSPENNETDRLLHWTAATSMRNVENVSGILVDPSWSPKGKNLMRRSRVENKHQPEEEISDDF